MEVRAANPDEAEVAARVLATVAEEGLVATEPPVDVAARADRFRAMLDSDDLDQFWVLVDGTAIVGVAGAHEGPPGVLSLGMAILPEKRGAGGGTLLMRAIRNYAERHGVHKLELEVWPENERAIALYEAQGFEREGLKRDHYRRRDGSLRSAIVMGRRMPPG